MPGLTMIFDLTVSQKKHFHEVFEKISPFSQMDKKYSKKHTQPMESLLILQKFMVIPLSLIQERHQVEEILPSSI